jgi:menaquinone reductase, multiheme cytochrome c subunit
MALIFPKSTDKYVRIGGLVLGVLLVGGASAAVYLALPSVVDTGYSPVQPVPYSHKLHAGDLGLDCYYCHFTANKSAYAAVPPAETCMNCHQRVRTQSPRLQRVRDSYASGNPVQWVRIHRLPDFVYFNHKAHLTAGVSCVSCHGRIDQMIEVKQVQPLSMAWCLDCHRNPAPNIRPIDEVTNLAWKPDGDPAVIGQELIRSRGLNPPQNCSGCHR